MPGMPPTAPLVFRRIATNHSIRCRQRSRVSIDYAQAFVRNWLSKCGGGGEKNGDGNRYATRPTTSIDLELGEVRQ